MKIEEIIEAARADNESAFGRVNDKRAAKIVRAAFKQVKNQIDLVPDGRVMIGGLGRFVIRKVEREQDGTKVSKRRILFHQGDVIKRRATDQNQP